MRLRSSTKRFARCMVAAAQEHESPLAGKTEQAKHDRLRCARSSARGGQEEVFPDELQEVLWKRFFADRALWWDNRRSKRTPKHPDFKHKVSKIPLWLNSHKKPCWVDSELAKMDSGEKTIPEAKFTSGHGLEISGEIEDYSELQICRKRLCEGGKLPQAVDFIDSLVQRGRYVPSNLFYRALKVCILNKDLALGRRIHALTVKGGYEGDAFLATHLINLYASHGRLEDAKRVFAGVSTPDAYNWAAIIFAYARHGEAAEAAQAIQLYRQMCDSTSVELDDHLYSAVLKACAAAKDLAAGMEVHARIRASLQEPDEFVQAGLVDMYAKCRSLGAARDLFDKLSNRNIVTWTSMIAGYAQEGMGQEALSLYRSMKQDGFSLPDSVTYVCLLQACATVGAGALDEGKQLHREIAERGLDKGSVLGGSLVNMYAKCGALPDARRLFDELPEKNILAWNVMIAGYTQQRVGREALNLYGYMHQHGLAPNSVTYVCLLQACASLGLAGLHSGKQLHAEIEDRGMEEDVVLGRSLLNMYVKCGSLKAARSLFDKLPERDVVAWTAMIAGYAQQGMGPESLSLYSSMRREGLSPDCFTYTSLLQACVTVGVAALEEGKKLHAEISERGLEEDAVLGSSLVNMYAKCGKLEEAWSIFEKIPKRNLVAWNAMIAAYAQQGMGQEALSLSSSMRREGLTPDSVTYVCLLQACAAVAALPVGVRLHAEIEERGLQADGSIGAALVNMYAKCGSMGDSQRVFDSLAVRSIEAWGALVGGYARQGNSQVVFDLIDRMSLEGIHPNEITFLSVLTVCSHVGLVDKGREYFEAMRTDYGLTATREHYVCMVDLLGRAGLLDEALHMAKAMPFPQNGAVWSALLGACMKWKNVEIGQHAFKGAVSVDGKDAAAHALMSNIYASSQMWEASNEMKARQMKLGAWKKPGQSCLTDTSGVVHAFLVGNKKHPESEGIYARVE